jgi:hypothetical protein
MKRGLASPLAHSAKRSYRVFHLRRVLPIKEAVIKQIAHPLPPISPIRCLQ